MSAAPKVLSPLRHRDFRLLWIGMSGSLLGDGILLVALAWQVYTLAGVPAAMSAVGVALSLPQVATLLVGGVVSDRFDRRRIMLMTDVVRGGCLVALAILAAAGTLALWHIVVLVAGYGAAAGFFGPAFDALVPELVDEDDLVAANSLDQFVRPLAMQMAGPTLGGALIATVGTSAAFAVDAATFAVSAGCLLAMRSRPMPAPAEVPIGPDAEPARVATGRRRHGRRAVRLRALAGAGDAIGSMRAEIWTGFAYVRGNVWLWATFVAASFTYLLVVGPLEVLLPYVVKNDLHAGATDYGLILASGGLGAVVAALIVGQTGIPRRFMSYIYVSWTLAALTVVVYGFATASWQLAAACAAINGLEAAGTIAWATAKQRLVPDDLLGRVSSVDWFVSTALVPLSYALAAPVAGALGARATLVGAGLIGAVVTFGFIYLPGVRRPEDLAVPSSAPSSVAVPV